MINEIRDEFKLSGVLEQLAGHWRFPDAGRIKPVGPSPVDIAATNEYLVLGGQSLDGFVGVRSGDPRISPVENLPPSARPISPERVVVILLCGGMGTRSGGKVHPLLSVQVPGAPGIRTLLDLQLDRLAKSPLAGAVVLLLGSLLNETALRQHLAAIPTSHRPGLYLGGLVPRLDRSQLPAGPPIIYEDPSGQSSYNPTGHLDALRWLVGSGLLGGLRDKDIIMVASYSNGGRLFTNETLRLAGHTVACEYQDHNHFCIVEVVARRHEKRTGSLLVNRINAPRELRLVKYHYGPSMPQLPAEDQVLMSTNTLYFSVPGLLRRLSQACSATGKPSSREAMDGMLQAAAAGQRRAEALAVFDAAFPVRPSLICKGVSEGREVIQAERDLDQISLVSGPTAFQAVEVGPERAISLKLPADLDDPAKRRYLVVE